jgi:TonB-dependent starch-binding outer membrane protein SusC
MIKSNAYVMGGFLLFALASATGKLSAQATKPVILDSFINVQPVEVISNGYMTIERKNVTSAISTVNENRIKEMAGASINSLLQGQAAGVRVTNTSGQPGSGALVNIRGAATINGGTDPLYIVDGIPVKVSRFRSLGGNIDNDPLTGINPQDIESITILKDAQGTALYGMRGANGVIIIKTYGGTAGKTYLDFSMNMGIMQAPDHYPVFDANQYKNYILEKEKARGLTDAQIASGVGRYLLISTPQDQVERYNNNTDWQDEVYKNGMYSDYHLTLRGGDAIAKYSLNVGYTKIKGVIKETDLERFGARFNLDYKVGKKLSFLNTIGYTRTDRNLAEEGNSYNTNPIVLSTLKNPMLTPFQQTNEGLNLRQLDSADFGGRNNLYGAVHGLTNKTTVNRIMGRITAQYTFSPSLNLRIAGAGDYYRLDETRFRPAEGFAPEEEAIRSSSVAKSYELMVLNENTLNFTKNLNSGRHIIDATIGTAYQNTAQDTRAGVYINAQSDLFSGISSGGNTGGSNPATDRNIDSIGSVSPQWKLLSFFATAQYQLKGKYIFGANFRADGSSRFAKDNRWGYFPSVSAAWRIISKESIAREKKILSDIKLRASFGISGNQEVGYYNAFNALVPSPYNRVSAIRIGVLGNPDFQWEDTKQYNLGLDAELLNGHLGFNLDAYVRETNHLYNTIQLPSLSGFTSYAVSEGSVRNKGIELTLYSKVGNNNFAWQTQLTAAYNKNEILSLPEKLIPVFTYSNYEGVLRKGESIGSFYGYNALGVYSRTSQVNTAWQNVGYAPFQGGDIIFESINGDALLNDGDKMILGNTNPDFFGGFTNIFSFKGFDLTVFMDFASGQKVFNAHRALLESMSNYDNQSPTTLNRWRNEGDVSTMPRLLHGDAVGNTRFSSRWMEDASYARFKAVTLGYNFPLRGILKGTFKNARVSITGQNLYTFTDYEGNSPDVANVNNPFLYGVDNGNTPPLRTFLVGVKLGF